MEAVKALDIVAMHAANWEAQHLLIIKEKQTVTVQHGSLALQLQAPG